MTAKHPHESLEPSGAGPCPGPVRFRVSRTGLRSAARRSGVAAADSAMVGSATVEALAAAAALVAVVLVVVAAGTLSPRAAVAAPAPVHPTPADTLAVEVAADSADAESDLRSRQRSFERGRSFRFPFTSPRSERCDEIVGRFCFWHEDYDAEPRWGHPDEWEEREATLQEREELLAALTVAARRWPGSRWVTGQRVRYLVQDDRPDEALEAARECRVSREWCAALAGFALHAGERFVEADSAFRVALEAMPEEERCEWRDVELLLEGDARDRYSPLDCDEREEFQERLWWAAEPLHLVPGNDRRTEHYFRRAMNRLQKDSSSPFGRSWASDLSELLMRYGWPVAWQRVRRGPYEIGVEPRVVGHMWPRALRFVPSSEVLEDPASAGPEAWDLRPYHPRSKHAPAHVEILADLDHRLLFFPRGDSVRIVAEYAMDPEEVADDASVEALLGASEGPDDNPGAEVRVDEARPEGSLQVLAPLRPLVVSVETLDREGKRAERARYGVEPGAPPSGMVSISDLLVLRDASGEAADPAGPGEPSPGVPDGGETALEEAPPETLEEAVPRAMGRLEARPGVRVGLYWELYGVPRTPEGFRVSVSLRQERGGFFRGIARAVGLADRDDPAVKLSWRDGREDPAPYHPRSLYLTLPEELEEGEYRIRVSVEVPGYEEIVAEREIRVLEAEEPGE